jgi:hypothetical protein
MVSVPRRVTSFVSRALLVIGVVMLFVSLGCLHSTARDASGGDCGSVWHWRSAGQRVSGGEMPDAMRASLSAECHRDALPRYRRGVGLAAAGAVMVGLGGIGVLATRRSERA